MADTEASAPTSYTDLAEVIESLPLLCREARRARGLSLRAAAEQMDVSFSTVTRFERGEGVTLASAAALLRWLDQRTPAKRRLATAATRRHRPMT